MPQTSSVLACCCALAVLAGTGTVPARAGQAPGEDSEIRQLRKDAEGGDARAQFRLGVRYATGTGVAEDDAVAAQWIRMAAEQGFVDAEYNLGLMPPMATACRRTPRRRCRGSERPPTRETRGPSPT
jgi:TPR repeat protein